MTGYFDFYPEIRVQPNLACDFHITPKVYMSGDCHEVYTNANGAFEFDFGLGDNYYRTITAWDSNGHEITAEFDFPRIEYAIGSSYVYVSNFTLPIVIDLLTRITV